MSKLESIPNIESVMTKTPITAEFDTPLRIAARLMCDHSIRHLPIVEGSSFVGLISDRDLKVAQELERLHNFNIEVGDICSKDVYSVGPNTPIDEVVKNMAAESIGSAIIIEHGEVIGIFTTVDLCRCYANLLKDSL